MEEEEEEEHEDPENSVVNDLQPIVVTDGGDGFAVPPTLPTCKARFSCPDNYCKGNDRVEFRCVEGKCQYINTPCPKGSACTETDTSTKLSDGGQLTNLDCVGSTTSSMDTTSTLVTTTTVTTTTVANAAVDVEYEYEEHMGNPPATNYDYEYKDLSGMTDEQILALGKTIRIHTFAHYDGKVTHYIPFPDEQFVLDKRTYEEHGDKDGIYCGSYHYDAKKAMNINHVWLADPGDLCGWGSPYYFVGALIIEPAAVVDWIGAYKAG